MNNEPKNNKKTNGNYMTYIGAGLAVFNNGRILLVTENRAAKRGLWNLPAGRPDPGEPLKLCAQREFAEETGANAAVKNFLGVFETVVGSSDRILFFVFLGKLIGKKKPIQATWFSKDEVRQLSFDGHLRSSAIMQTVELVNPSGYKNDQPHFESMLVNNAPSITT